MKKLLLLIAFSAFAVSAVFADWFPINGWGIKRDTTWVKEVDSLWYGNSTRVHYMNCENTKSLLIQGDACDIDFIYSGMKDTLTPTLSLTDMARGQYSIFEYEWVDSCTTAVGVISQQKLDTFPFFS